MTFREEDQHAQQRSALRTAKTDGGKLLESINAILDIMLVDE